jgi:hypothetical protein
MGSMHNKTSIMVYNVSGDNYARGRHTCVCDQNFCDSKSCKVQKTVLITDKDNRCTGMEQIMQQGSLTKKKYNRRL